MPLERRTLIQGAAWTVPAIVLATASPALAVSGTVLTFNASSFRGAGCDSISDATVIATASGVGVAGVVVTLSLSGGYLYAGGGTSYTGTTGSGGSLTIPTITVPAAGGNGTLTATSSGVSAATAGLSSTARHSTNAMWTKSGTSSVAGVVTADNARPLGYGYALTSTGVLYAGGTAITEAAPILAAVPYTNRVDGTRIDALRADGVVVVYAGSRGLTGYSATTSTKLLGNGYTLTGDTLFYQGSSLIASGVVNGRGYTNMSAEGTLDAVDALLTNGTVVQYWERSGRNGFNAISSPPDTALGYGYTLSGSTLSFADSTVRLDIVSGVQSARAYEDTTGQRACDVVVGGRGMLTYRHISQVAGVDCQIDDVCLGNGYYLSGSTLYYRGAVAAPGDNVVAAAAYLLDGRDERVDHVNYSSSC